MRRLFTPVVDGRFNVDAVGAAHAPRLSRCYPQRMTFILKWLLSAAALLAVAYLYPGVQVTSFTAALIGSLIYSALQLAIEFVLGSLFSKK